ncbi:3-keto-5-aminohexanoate cleavage protein [Pseudooceanicola sp.]|uniref:3-keto-5-aminohexanoate cleavage protein n=1 Tax=Pseudooceanicola sp. TaxID=1914328 RepID=UPI00261597AD|nr:3-keto-5-aminohexanoate cleavage protein [Pseudooceanicola sp.]MDF1856926.1 3-keto-5-aminohexanoate cleavage protein [Pseudooceanicola sp.]
MTMIMLAPNGGRRLQSEHPAIPLSIAETADCARDGAAAGADAIHVHLRDAAGGHLLDAGGYREMMAEVARLAPSLAVQITTESIGIYTPAEQMRVVRESRPAYASCALREMIVDDAAALAFYAEMAEAGIGIQHILYTEADALRLRDLVTTGALPAATLSLIFVVGSYPDSGGIAPRQLAKFLGATEGLTAEWSVCAFGQNETRVLAAAMALGGHARVGFENSLQMADGSIAADNAARLREIAGVRAALGLTPGDTARALGGL